MTTFQLLRLYWKLRPYINQLEEIFSMKLTTATVVQALMVIMQAYNQFGALIPAKWKGLAALAIGVIQLALGYLQHISDPVTGIIMPRRGR